MQYHGESYDADVWNAYWFEKNLHYVSSGYYDPKIGQRINADDTAYFGVDGTPLSSLPLW